ncbi:hypothetical protein R1sor_024448 [Riccia sorocarpa]|uniref:NAC domain-containing protein n=1 Tax=Riccia sorocarpa TaxID=122646 RepID=A0ABD3GSS6_9MARC
MSIHYGSANSAGGGQLPEATGTGNQQPPPSQISPINAKSKLPWGWHFRPTAAELITNLDNKVKRQRQERNRLEPEDIHDVFESDVLREIDLSQVEPWEIKGIPETCSIRATHADDLNQYFYTQKEQKYRHGKRSNRATRRGFWKATGRDKPIYGKMSHRDKGKRIIGYRKALVFYEGRAPNGNKTDWILHEYRLEADPDSTEEQWVACHMFIKERNVTPREVPESSIMPEAEWPELAVKEETDFPTYTDPRRTMLQQQGPELASFHLLPCVRDDLSLPRLEEDDNHHYSARRDVFPCDVGVPPCPEGALAVTRVPPVVSYNEQERLIAELLNTYAENPQQSIWSTLGDGPPVPSDSFWNVHSLYGL